MHSPFHDELTPSSGREKRIDRALRSHSARKQARAQAALNEPPPGSNRAWGRLAIAGALATVPLLVFVAVMIVSNGGPSLNFVGSSSSNVPPGTGHEAPLVGSSVVPNTPPAAVATNAAIIPTPTIIMEPDTGMATPETCNPVNAAGTPVTDSQCSPTPTATPSSPVRPAPRNASVR